VADYNFKEEEVNPVANGSLALEGLQLSAGIFMIIRNEREQPGHCCLGENFFSRL